MQKLKEIWKCIHIWNVKVYIRSNCNSSCWFLQYSECRKLVSLGMGCQNHSDATVCTAGVGYLSAVFSRNIVGRAFRAVIPYH